MDASRRCLSTELPPDFPAERVALVDLLDRLLAEGVVVTGEITLSIADVDLVTVSLRALLASVSTLDAVQSGAPESAARPSGANHKGAVT
jgi:hypothetical protein